ncbi:MAG: FHA domain-containing protein, partial [Armatimonadetes bacterium]|nr:FHA domain-containing protein [Armatimonadota bacterium]
ARRAVLALTDGNDTASHTTPDEIIRHARASGVSLYLIGLGTDVNRPLLTYLAGQTGGECYFAPTGADLETLYRRMAARFRTEYRVTFRSPRPERDGRRREVQVTVGGTDLPPATTWYQAPGPGSLVVAVAQDEAPGAPLASGGSGFPARFGFLALVALALVLAAGGMAWFLRFRPRAARTGHPLTPLWVTAPVTRVGRDREADLQIDNARVSRHHARIEAAGNAFLLVDEGSSNGTFVNRRRVRRAVLRPGDEVAFADSRFQFAGLLAPQAPTSPPTSDDMATARPTEPQRGQGGEAALPPSSSAPGTLAGEDPTLPHAGGANG